MCSWLTSLHLIVYGEALTVLSDGVMGVVPTPCMLIQEVESILLLVEWLGAPYVATITASMEVAHTCECLAARPERLDPPSWNPSQVMCAMNSVSVMADCCKGLWFSHGRQWLQQTTADCCVVTDDEGPNLAEVGRLETHKRCSLRNYTTLAESHIFLCVELVTSQTSVASVLCTLRNISRYAKFRKTKNQFCVMPNVNFALNLARRTIYKHALLWSGYT